MGYTSYRLAEANKWTVHTHQVIQELKDSLSALLDVETSERGYLATGKKLFLEPYNNGRTAVEVNLNRLAEMTVDNAEQQVKLQKLNQIAREKLAFTDQTISGDPKIGLAIVATGKGKAIMDAYRAQVNEMIEIEKHLLEKRMAESAATQTALFGTAAALMLLSCALLGWVSQITRNALNAERDRVDELDKLNSGLEAEIEQRKKVEKALKDATVKLTSSNTDLQRFAYVASHDLQEPLRAVAGFLTLIAKKHKGTLDEESEVWINHAVEGSQRMRTLINDLLAYARVESRGGELTLTDLNSSLRQAQKDLRVAIEESETEIVSNQLPTLRADGSQITQVFQNLIGNAIKFQSDKKPHVEVQAKLEGDEWLFTVQDNGIGFESEHVDRIFIIFQRLHGREDYKGTGIGLALCKKIIERHGGRIWAESEQGKGSKFSFTLPNKGGEPSESTEINKHING